MTKTIKKILSLGLVLCMVAFFGVFAAACDNGEEENPDNQTTTTYYVVSFNVNGHGSAPSAQSVEENGYATQPADLTADGYVFGGWYKEADCENEFVFTTEKITADTVIYAKWTESDEPDPEAPTTFAGFYHVYQSGYSGDINGNAYSADNVWTSTNAWTGITTTYTYSKITVPANSAVKIFWHIDGLTASTEEETVEYKFDIRLDDGEFTQDSTIRSTWNMWIGSDAVYSEWNRTFGLIGLQTSFTQDEIDGHMYQIILENPGDEDVAICIICAGNDSH